MKQKGFVMLELLIALIIFTLILTFTALFFKSFTHNLKLALSLKQQLNQAENDLETVQSGNLAILPTEPYANHLKKVTAFLNKRYKIELLIYEKP